MMQRKTVMLGMTVAAALLLSGVSPGAQAPAKTGKPGKPTAPVDIVGVMKKSSASITITFKTAAQGVAVRVYGTDGLAVVGSETPVTSASYTAGQTLKLDVGYTPGAGQSNLAVVVTGQFAGNQRSRTTSFTVGDKRAAAPQRNDLADDGNGKAVIVMPAEPR